MTGNFWDLLQAKFISPMRQFCEKDKSFMVIQSKNGKIWVFLSFSHVYVSLVGSVTIANGQIEWSQSTNFNRIQDGAWFNLTCVYNLKFRKLSNLGLVQFLIMF